MVCGKNIGIGYLAGMRSLYDKGCNDRCERRPFGCIAETAEK